MEEQVYEEARSLQDSAKNVKGWFKINVKIAIKDAY
jgi:hypothetical protein